MRKKKKAYSLHERFSLYNFATAIFPAFIAILLTFLLMISLIHMIYSGDLTSEPVISNSRDIISAYFYHFNIREIENTYKNSDNPSEKKPSYIARHALKKLEHYGFIVYVDSNGETLYLTDGANEKVFYSKLPKGIENAKGYTFLDENTSAVKDSIVSKSGHIITVRILGTGDAVFEPNIAVTKLWQMSSAEFVFIAFLFVILCTLINVLLVRSLSNSVITPIESMGRSIEKIKDGEFSEPIEFSSNITELEKLGLGLEDMRQTICMNIGQIEKNKEDLRLTFSEISHDSRTALMGIKGYTQGLMEGIANTPEKKKKYVNAIYNSTLTLEKLIESLSEITLLELNDMALHLKEKDMYDVLEKWYMESVEAFEEKKIHVRFINKSDKRIFCAIDNFQMERVIDNIITNSIKYKKPDSEYADVTVTFGISRDNMFEAIYRDNGIGIKPEDSEKIFDLFYRADEARSNVQAGSGLGLSIVKQIILKHNGTIKADGNPGEGITLVIKLPIIKIKEI